MSGRLYPHTRGVTCSDILPLQSTGNAETSCCCNLNVAGYCRASLLGQSTRSVLGQRWHQV